VIYDSDLFYGDEPTFRKRIIRRKDGQANPEKK